MSNSNKKTDYNTNISETENKTATNHHHDKYATTQELNKLTANNLTVRLAQVNLVSINDFANFVKKSRSGW